MPILTLCITVPLLGGIFLLLWGRDRCPRAVKIYSLLVGLVTLGLTCQVVNLFDMASPAMQLVEVYPWIQPLNIQYALGVDGLSLSLLVLSAFCTVLVLISAWRVIENRVAQYYAAFLILQACMAGAFLATDAILFYVFWEALLIPMFLIIGIWGGPRRVYATIKFFLYTFLGSVFMLVALIYLFMHTGSFQIQNFYGLPIPIQVQHALFVAFLLAFAVKIPMVPVHTWLPDAHVEAPTGGSVILAAILLKLGGYGFLRFTLPIVPQASLAWAEPMIILSLIAVIYIGFIAIVQKDMKKLIAYSSIAHMGFVTLGIFVALPLVVSGDLAQARMALEGSIVQMISHGLISSALFLCVGVLYDRMHSREIADYGGVMHVMPVFSAFAVFFAMGNVGLPGTSGFVGELMVILATFKYSLWIAVLAGMTLLLSPAYTLWMIRRVFYGSVMKPAVAELSDVSCREKGILAVLAIAVIGLGIWPEPLLMILRPSVFEWTQHLQGVLS